MVLVEAAEDRIDGGPPPPPPPTVEAAAARPVDPGPGSDDWRIPPEVEKKWLLSEREEGSGYARRLLVEEAGCDEEEVDLSWSMARSAAMVGRCCEWLKE